MPVATEVDLAREWLATADVRAMARRAKAENFPVASLLFPSALRPAIASVYAVARLIDEAGDTAPVDLRLPILDALEIELPRRGSSDVPAIRALPDDLPFQSFLDLVAANRQDQHVDRYATRADLLGYCALSAAPVGRIVLHLLGLATPERVAWSDSVCAGLQVAEHLQDVGEDLAARRVYLPQESMATFDVTPDLLARVGSASVPERGRVAALLAGEADWARSLLDTPLVRTVPGRSRLAVAGFVAGGRAALDGVLAAGPDAVHGTPRPRRVGMVRHLVGALR